MSTDDIHMNELDINDNYEGEVTQEIYVNLYQMKFESLDVANIATAMNVDEELCEELKLPDSSDDEEESESESKKETPKEKQERLKAFAEENLGKLEVPEKAKRSNRKVTNKQIEDFVLLIDDGIAIEDAAATTVIKLRSACNYRKLHLKDVHSDLIIKHIDVHSTTNLMQIKDLRKLIEDRGYKCVYLPPYSPFLNPIEEFWSKVKSGIKRNPLDTTDRLTPRIMDAVTHVTL
ncbi:hypothetical protein G6F46_008587 [Rhizopus delemar]|uniref:Tc1-like transposase DDE domain-containing protein n=2 Tax=Rhizopus TaxID=4842 RepID=A0A9P7CLY0_9FUNG|nr:hypothetical protein G6F55_007526 [Rhizopus delemar]KAG1547183.1 hypothetical protein G6F51_004426 [Rhizopus arrhizus]KAG1493793.1 hypothetical protein G6F54_008329 [Rhizopus delemar]KAG1508217.1 hypothetical protein G6F53_008362 [Rhizopus delemar]KAG1523221.1 hypothetical protein G6F52_005197 [Rhizopus delemar]